MRATTTTAFGPVMIGCGHQHRRPRCRQHSHREWTNSRGPVNPTTGQFTTQDPLDGQDGTTTVANPYHYVNNDPFDQTDPLGLHSQRDMDLRAVCLRGAFLFMDFVGSSRGYTGYCDSGVSNGFHLPSLRSLAALVPMLALDAAECTVEEAVGLGFVDPAADAACAATIAANAATEAGEADIATSVGVEELTPPEPEPSPDTGTGVGRLPGTGGGCAPQGGADDDCDSGLLYRGGSRTQEALTPRPGNDTVGWPHNGLSTYTVKARACARSTKVQVLSPALLATVPGLQLAPDPGGPSHIFLQGNTEALHDEWAASRDSTVSPEHRLTTGVRSSILRTEPC